MNKSNELILCVKDCTFCRLLLWSIFPSPHRTILLFYLTKSFKNDSHIAPSYLSYIPHYYPYFPQHKTNQNIQGQYFFVWSISLWTTNNLILSFPHSTKQYQFISCTFSFLSPMSSVKPFIDFHSHLSRLQIPQNRLKPPSIPVYEIVIVTVAQHSTVIGIKHSLKVCLSLTKSTSKSCISSQQC